MEKALVDLLLATSAVTALAGDRITWGLRGTATGLPALVLHVISDVPEYSDDGFDGLTQARVQIDVWAKTHLSGLQLRSAVMGRLSGFKGVAGGVEFAGIYLDNRSDSVEGTGKEPLYRFRMDFHILHNGA